MEPIVWVKEFSDEGVQPVPGIAGKFKRYVDSKDTDQRLISGIGRLEPGEDMGWHSHPEEELFFVLRGVGTMRWEVNGQIHEAEAGPNCAFFKVGNVPHQMVNTGSEPLIGIFFKVSGDEKP